MNSLELMAVSLYGIYSLVAFISGWRECKKKNIFGIAPTYYLLGAFVWGDALVFGLFWTVVSAIIILVQDWLLFLLIVSAFWLVRSIGETIYWLLQQFTTIRRFPIRYLPGHVFFGEEGVLFIYQTVAQIIAVISLITTVYLFNLWL